MEKNHNFLLDVLERTYYRYDDRAEMKGIFENEEFIYNTDLYSFVKIPKKLLKKYLYETLINTNENRKNLASIFEVLKKKNGELNDIKVDFEFFKKFLSEHDTAPTGENKKCTECNGSGDVEWSYQGKKGNIYEKDFECPRCKGDGLMERVFQKKIEGSKTFYKEYISIAHHQATDRVTILAKYFRIFVKILEYYQHDKNVQVSIALNKDNIIFSVNNEIELLVTSNLDYENNTEALNFQF